MILQKWKCKGYKCDDYQGTNPFGNAPCCRNMEYRLKRLVLIDELKNCDELKEENMEKIKEGRLLTDREMSVSREEAKLSPFANPYQEGCVIAQAQLTKCDAEYNKLIKEVGQEGAKFDKQRMKQKNAECRARVEGIFREIESNSSTCAVERHIRLKWWQALKKKNGIK